MPMGLISPNPPRLEILRSHEDGPRYQDCERHIPVNTKTLADLLCRCANVSSSPVEFVETDDRGAILIIG